MDETPIIGGQEQNLIHEVIALAGARRIYGGRGRWRRLSRTCCSSCRQQREEWLPLVRLNLGRLFALAGDWPALRPLLGSEEHLEQLRQLHVELEPRLRLVIEPTTSARRCGALAELRQSIERFNDRWQAFLPTIDLTTINELREGYNRYYLIEKEAVVNSPGVARQGFQPLELLTHADLAEVLPLLPVPEPAD